MRSIGKRLRAAQHSRIGEANPVLGTKTLQCNCGDFYFGSEASLFAIDTLTDNDLQLTRKRSYKCIYIYIPIVGDMR
jgi:hypothetical protein